MILELHERGEAYTLGLDNLTTLLKERYFARAFLAGAHVIVKWQNDAQLCRSQVVLAQALSKALRAEAEALAREIETAAGVYRVG